jgi:hypothetical protein
MTPIPSQPLCRCGASLAIVGTPDGVWGSCTECGFFAAWPEDDVEPPDPFEMDEDDLPDFDDLDDEDDFDDEDDDPSFWDDLDDEDDVFNDVCDGLYDGQDGMS